MGNLFQTRRNRLLSGAAAVALALGATPAYAQPDPVPGQVPQGEEGQPDAETQDIGDDGNAIVVTGFRAALQSAARQKRESDLIVESVSAEEIGRLPDASIAESIARLPGLTSQRLDGRSQQISIRGFAPDFSTTLLNGREQVTVGDNRGVEFDQYPSEVMNQVLVYKTPNASLVGQGLSGTVDLRTIRPLSYGRRVFTIGGRVEFLDNGEVNPAASDRGWRVSTLYVGQTGDDRMGYMVGIAHTDSPSQIERFRSWGYPGVNANANVIGGTQPFAIGADLRRTAVVGALEFQPTPSFNMVIDGYFSRFEDEQLRSGVEIPLFWSGAQLQPGFTVADGLVTSGQFKNVVSIVRNDEHRRNANIYAFGFNGRWSEGGWTVIGDASYSGVDRQDLVLETYAGTGAPGLAVPETIGFNMTNRGATFQSNINYGDPNLIRLTSPQGWGGDVIPGGQDGYFNQRNVDDDLFAFRASVERELGGFFRSVELGANYTTRQKSLRPNEFFLSLAARNNGTATSVTVPPDARLPNADLSWAGLGTVLTWDPTRLLNSGLYLGTRNPNSDVSTKGWLVTEDVLSGWAMLNLNGDLGGARLTGNVGVQVVRTDQFSRGTASSGAPAVLAADVSGGDTFTEVLPSANLVLRTGSNWAFRLGLARQMARPRMDDMRASSNFSFNEVIAKAGGNPFSGSGGNPRLRPWIANAADLSIEHYFGGEGYLALAGYYKDLETYIYPAVVPYNFTGFPVPAGITLQPSQFQGFLEIPQNGEGGSLYGAEFSGTLPFSLLTPMLRGFGVTGSVSYTKTNVRPSPNQPAEDLPGYSRWVSNVTAYFERDGFSLRGSMRHRSSFIGELRGFGGGNERQRAAGETIFDGQVSYAFQPGSALEGVTILGQVTNITNEPFVTFDPGQRDQIIQYHSFGRRYMVGVNFRM